MDPLILKVPAEGNKALRQVNVRQHTFEQVASSMLADLEFKSTRRSFEFLADPNSDLDLWFYAKENLFLSVLSSEQISCSCSFFSSEQVDSCVHAQALRRGLLAKNLLKDRISPIIHWNTLIQEFQIFGNWTKELLASFGCVFRYADSSEIEVVDSDLFKSRSIDSSKMFTSPAIKMLRKPVVSSAHLAINYKMKIGELYEYQKDGVNFLLHQGRCILADDMGLGKTIQTTIAMSNLFQASLVSSVLLVCPSSVKTQWKNEIEHFSFLTAKVFHNSKSFQKYLEEIKKNPEKTSPIIILNYELVNRNINDLIDMDFGLIVLDEAQKIKNAETKTWESISFLRSEFLYLLTGTPVENKIDNIFNLMTIVDKDFLGPKWKFEVRHNLYEGHRVVGHKNLPELKNKLAKRVLRRESKQVLKFLPGLVHNTRYVEITAQQASWEAKFLNDAKMIMRRAMSRELTMQERLIVQSLLLKARRAASAPELIEGCSGYTKSPKIDELEELLFEITPSSDRKVIIFSEWVDMLNLAKTRTDAMGLRSTMFYGGVASSSRQGVVDQFMTDPEVNILFASEAGGAGLNLQKACYVIHLDLPWNPARIDQRNGRAHRIKQENTVFAYYLVAENTIEHGIEGVLSSKRNVRQSVLTVSGSDAVSSEDDTIFLKSFMSRLREEG